MDLDQLLIIICNKCDLHIKPHIRGFFCLWDDVKKVLRIEPFVEIWDKEKKEWIVKKS